jgi:hypothetical protein
VQKISRKSTPPNTLLSTHFHLQKHPKIPANNAQTLGIEVPDNGQKKPFRYEK